MDCGILIYVYHDAFTSYQPYDDSGWSSLSQYAQGNSQIIFPFNELNVSCYGMNGLPGTNVYIYEHTDTPFHALSLSFPAFMFECGCVYAFVCDVCVCDCVRFVALTKTAVLWFCFGTRMRHSENAKNNKHWTNTIAHIYQRTLLGSHGNYMMLRILILVDGGM